MRTVALIDMPSRLVIAADSYKYYRDRKKDYRITGTMKL